MTRKASSVSLATLSSCAPMTWRMGRRMCSGPGRVVMESWRKALLNVEGEQCAGVGVVGSSVEEEEGRESSLHRSHAGLGLFAQRRSHSHSHIPTHSISYCSNHQFINVSCGEWAGQTNEEGTTIVGKFLQQLIESFVISAVEYYVALRSAWRGKWVLCSVDSDSRSSLADSVIGKRPVPSTLSSLGANIPSLHSIYHLNSARIPLMCCLGKD